MSPGINKLAIDKLRGEVLHVEENLSGPLSCFHRMSLLNDSGKHVHANCLVCSAVYGGHYSQRLAISDCWVKPGVIFNGRITPQSSHNFGIFFFLKALAPVTVKAYLGSGLDLVFNAFLHNASNSLVCFLS